MISVILMKRICANMRGKSRCDNANTRGRRLKEGYEDEYEGGDENENENED